jgi:hypothetical protein
VRLSPFLSLSLSLCVCTVSAPLSLPLSLFLSVYSECAPTVSNVGPAPGDLAPHRHPGPRPAQRRKVLPVRIILPVRITDRCAKGAVHLPEETHLLERVVFTYFPATPIINEFCTLVPPGRVQEVRRVESFDGVVSLAECNACRPLSSRDCKDPFVGVCFPDTCPVFEPG